MLSLIGGKFNPNNIELYREMMDCQFLKIQAAHSLKKSGKDFSKKTFQKKRLRTRFRHNYKI